MAGKNYGAISDKYSDPESESWNVASAFMQLKVLKLLILLDKYETISQFGVDELGEEIYFTPNDIAKRRRDGLFRFSSTLRQLLGNVRFAMKKGDVDGVNEFMSRIQNVENYFSDVMTSKENMVTREIEISINEDHFNTCFGVLQNIKEEINFPLNKAGLIFKASDEVDLDAIMQDIVESG